MKKSKSIFLFFLLLLTVSQLYAKLAAIWLKQLIALSDVIVVAEVQSVSRPLIGKRYARARVIQVLKGKESGVIKFLASARGIEDVSDAKKGEIDLLFLTRMPESQSYTVTFAGRGRMPLRVVAGKAYLTLWPDVHLPEGTPTIEGPDPQWRFIRSVEMATIRELVEKTMHEAN
jgi:hypothetical protein